MRRRIWVFLALAGLVAAACGGGGSSAEVPSVASDSSPAAEETSPGDAASSDDSAGEGVGGVAAEEPSGERARSAASRSVATAAVQTAAVQTAAAPAYEFEWQIAISASPDLPDGLEIVGGGAVDVASELAAFSMDFSAIAAALPGQEGLSAAEQDLMAGLFDGSMDVIVSGETVYLRWPLFTQLFGAKTEWVSLDSSDAGADIGELTGFEQFVAPEEFLAALQEASDLRESGRESVRGVATTRYSGTLDLFAASESLGSGEDVAQLETLFALTQADPRALGALPLDVWVDDEGFLRRFTMTFDFSGISPQMDLPTMSMSFELFGFGQPVSIELPPAGAVTDLSSLLASSIFGSFE